MQKKNNSVDQSLEKPLDKLPHKILHTSDWHLGKKLFKRSRLDEQALFLNWLIKIIQDKEIKFLIIAGDIFDTPHPPNEALDLYFNFLDKVSHLDIEPHIIIISGNHDSGKFIQAPSSILRRHNIHIKTKLSKNLDENIITIEEDNELYQFKCIPYFRSYELYQFLDNGQELTVNEVKKIIQKVSSYWPKTNRTSPSIRTVIVHHAVGDFAATGSEHLVNIMGLEHISLEWFGDDFDYMALGHIHKHQKMSSSKNIYYSGSPIPLRFSESQKKHIIQYQKSSKTELKEKIVVDKIEIPQFRNIIQVQADESNVLDKIEKKKLELDKLSSEQTKEQCAYWEIKLTLKSPDTALIDTIYKQVLDYGDELLSLIPEFKKTHTQAAKQVNVNKLNVLELFDLYYQEKFPNQKEIPEAMRQEFNKLLEEINREIS